MSHDHHDHRSLGITSLNKAFVIGIVLNAGFVVAEFIAGFWYNSLGLISDAGHNLGDVFSLVLAMLAFRLAKVSPTLRYTYGYKKSTILVSLLNAVILLVAVGFILGESIDKLFHPRPVDGDAVAWVAGVGVLVNALTAWLFVKDKEKDLNVKGAYLHMAADALVSVGVVVSGIVIQHTGWYMITSDTRDIQLLFFNDDDENEQDFEFSFFDAPGAYQMRISRMNRENSCITLWKQLNFKPDLTAIDKESIETISAPAMSMKLLNTSGSFTYNETLAPNEIVFVQMRLLEKN